MRVKIALRLPFQMAAVVCCAVIFCCFPVSVFSATAAIVLSSDLGIFNETADGCKEVFSKNGVDPTVYVIKDKDTSVLYKKIMATKPDVVVTVGQAASKGARENIKGIPLVISSVFCTEDCRADNATGVIIDIPSDLKIKTIKKILPNVHALALLYSRSSEKMFNEITETAEKEGLKVTGKSISSENEFADAFRDVCSKADCFLMLPDSSIYFSQTVKLMALEGVKNKVPIIGISIFYVRMGLPCALDCDYKDIGRQSGEIAAAILSGENPANIPPARPRKIRYALNTGSASKIGITFSPQALQGSCETIEQ
jgi:putative ABC transport system substrate-binding protein